MAEKLEIDNDYLNSLLTGNVETKDGVGSGDINLPDDTDNSIVNEEQEEDKQEEVKDTDSDSSTPKGVKAEKKTETSETKDKNPLEEKGKNADTNEDLTDEGLEIVQDAIIKLQDKLGIEFTDEQLAFKQAQEIGCTPDIDAWKLVMNSPDGYTSNLRAVGGHIHVGYNNPDDQTSFEIAKAMDLFLGVGSVLLDKDTQRRSLYGKAGAMRLKSFGMEYRTLSNFWIFDDKLISWVFNNTLKALEFINVEGIITNPEEIVKCINTCDKELALEILDDYHIEIPELQESEEQTTVAYAGTN